MNNLQVSNLKIFNEDVIPVYTTDTGEKIVVGRELHDRLKIATDYKDWFPRMCKYGFDPQTDFSSFLSESTGGRPAENHYLKLDMAKHIAMIQRTPEGKAIRQKLIDLEKAVTKGELKSPSNAMETLRLHYAALEELDERTTVIEEKIETVIERVDNQMTIDHGQQRTLQSAVGNRVYERAAVIYQPGDMRKNARNLFSALYRDLKNRFGVPSYRDIKPKDYPSAMKYVEAWVEPAELRDGVAG